MAKVYMSAAAAHKIQYDRDSLAARMRNGRKRRESRRYWRAFWNHVQEISLLAAIALVSIPGAAGLGLLIGAGLYRSF